MKTLTFIMLLIFCGSNAQYSIIEYPEWFLKPVKYKNTIIGYNTIDSGALDNAGNRFAAHKDCIVKGYLHYYLTSETESFYRNSDYFYYYSEDFANETKQKLLPLDSSALNILNHEYIELFGFDSIEIEKTKYINVDTLQNPFWLDKNMYEDSIDYYSVGLFTSMGKDNDAWYTSEERAIFNLLRNIAVEIYNVRIVHEIAGDTMVDDIIAYRLNYRLRGIEVVERFPLKNEKQFYTLIRVPKSGVTVKLNQELY